MGVAKWKRKFDPNFLFFFQICVDSVFEPFSKFLLWNFSKLFLDQYELFFCDDNLSLAVACLALKIWCEQKKFVANTISNTFVQVFRKVLGNKVEKPKFSLWVQTDQNLLGKPLLPEECRKKFKNSAISDKLIFKSNFLSHIELD